MYKVAVCLGIRPDFIRTSVLLQKMQTNPHIKLDFIFTGQHYDEELKEIFFREMEIPQPTFILDTVSESHIQQHALLISQLEECLNHIKPDVVIFLGDANAVVGCITPLKMGIPIAHIEAGMRSYDWSMPEERNRVIVDRVSDILYCYQQDYKYRLIQEGVCPDRIVVTGNTIVDVLNRYRPQILSRIPKVLERFDLVQENYGLMTLHRYENTTNKDIAIHILSEVADWSLSRGIKIILPIMPRLRPIVEDMGNILDNFILTKPLGFFDFVALEMCARIEFTDSGTNQETSALCGTPCVVTRRSTERPETFNSGITIMEPKRIYDAANHILRRKYNKNFSLGDGNSSNIIIDDILGRLSNKFNRHAMPINSFAAKNWTTYSGVLKWI